MNIISGLATVVYGPKKTQTTEEAKKTKNKKDHYCWHLPGGKTTTDRDHAERVAANMNDLMMKSGARAA